MNRWCRANAGISSGRCGTFSESSYHSPKQSTRFLQHPHSWGGMLYIYGDLYTNYLRYDVLWIMGKSWVPGNSNAIWALLCPFLDSYCSLEIWILLNTQLCLGNVAGWLSTPSFWPFSHRTTILLSYFVVWIHSRSWPTAYHGCPWWLQGGVSPYITCWVQQILHPLNSMFDLI